MRTIERIKKRLKREYLGQYSRRKAYHTYKKLRRPEIMQGTVFFDYEGEWARAGQKENSIRGVLSALKILEKLGIRATFNTVGKMFDRDEVIRKILEGKHEIASHTYEHENVENFSKLKILKDFDRYQKKIAGKGITLEGFRAPQSKWNIQVLDGLLESGITWNAENCEAVAPYVIRESRGNRLWRIPVNCDDWGFEGDKFSPSKMLEYWSDRYYTAKERKAYFAIGFHPWVLAKEPGRLGVFEQFLKILVADNGLDLMPFREIALGYDKLLTER